VYEQEVPGNRKTEREGIKGQTRKKSARGNCAGHIETV
jgi:hypothetical protein